MTAIRFSGHWPWWLILAAGIAGSLIISRWYWRESCHLQTPMRWLLPLLRGLAFFLIFFMLAGPTLYHQHIQGELSRIRVLLDVSKSMSTIDDKREGRTRLESSLYWLIGNDKKPDEPNGWLNELKQYHRVELVASHEVNGRKLLWNSLANNSLPKVESITPQGRNSPLGEFLAQAIQNGGDLSANTAGDPGRASDSGVDVLAAVVLISDGQSNAGTSISQAVSSYLNRRVPIFAIGVGSESEPEDLGIVQVEHSQRVNRLDRVKGSIMIKERIKAGTPYSVSILHFGKRVFSDRLESNDQGQRRIEFDIAAEQLIDESKSQLTGGIDTMAVPIDLQFAIECESAEISTENNSYANSLWGVDQKNRVLILDRRGGWEMRYIKNAMERDPAWESTIALGRLAIQDLFPRTRTNLFEYDLILATLDTIIGLGEEQKNWISDFVALSGGGLVVIDSSREPSVSTSDAVFSALLPVHAVDSSNADEIKSMRLTPLANDQPAFQLGESELTRDQIWSKLLPPKSARMVELKPGAEAMVQLIGPSGNHSLRPLIATKLFGQGRVVYFAADETWRWRYNVADLYQQRFWNQIAIWSMRAPFAVNDAFASLDAGQRAYSTGDPITVRAKLKQDDLQPLTNASVRVILERDGVHHVSIQLDQEPGARGFYRTTLVPMPVGSYRVRLEVVGVTDDALSLETQFIVHPPIDVEMQALACNQELLRQAAFLTGGEFSMLDKASTISEKLTQYRTGRIAESQTLLWQSYPWFATIIGLLAIEWHLRKRSGLI